MEGKGRGNGKEKPKVMLSLRFTPCKPLGKL